MGLFGSAPKAPEPRILQEWQGAADRAGKLGERILDRPTAIYQGDRVADMTTGQDAALRAITTRGMNGNPLDAQAQGYASDVLGGKYLDQENPYLKKAMAAAMGDVGRSVGNQFAGLGMSGSSGNQQYLSEAFADASAPLMFQNYQNERNAQQQMAGLAPTLANQDYVGLQQALQAQGMYQVQNQAEMDAQRQKFGEKANDPMFRLQGVMGAIGGQMAPVMMGGSPGSQGLIPGILQGAMGGAMAGGAAGGPWGAAAGGILGGVGGGMANK